MSAFDLDKMLDELGISNPEHGAARQSKRTSTESQARALLFFTGKFSRLESLVLSAMWERFGIVPIAADTLTPFEMIRMIARESINITAVTVLVGREAPLVSLAALTTATRYNGKQLHLCFAEGVGESLKPVNRKLLVLMAKHAHRIAVLSGRALNHWEELGLSCTVMFPMIESSTPNPTSGMQPRLSTYVCNHGSEVHSLVNAFAAVKSKYPRAELTIYHDFPETIVSSTPGLSYCKLTDHTVAMFCQTEIYVHLTSIAGSFIPFMLTQASGIPAVVSDFGNAREFVIQGDNAILARLNDTNSVANGILSLVEQDALRKQIQEGAVMASNDYSFQCLSDDWSRFLGIIPIQK